MNLKQGQVSSYILFIRKYQGTRLSKGTLQKKFLAEVDRGDYRRAEQAEIIRDIFIRVLAH